MSHGTDGYRFYENPVIHSDAVLHERSEEATAASTIPLWLRFSVVLKRLPRAACQICLKRRVLFVLAVEPGGPNGMAMCAECAGVR